MTHAEKAQHFTDLHQPGDPVVLYNVWDAGTAGAVEKAGAKALATGSWSVAAAQGYDDGEQIPLDFLAQIAQRICHSTSLPVSIDFEGAYAKSPDQVSANARQILLAGAVGINFEDRVVGGEGLHNIALQAERIQAIRKMAEEEQIPFYINARTDLFLKADASEHGAQMDAARERADAYQQAGASGLFVPGLIDASLIKEICQHTNLPVNVMMKEGVPSIPELAELGVARVSFGPGPYVAAMNWLSGAAQDLYPEA